MKSIGMLGIFLVLGIFPGDGATRAGEVERIAEINRDFSLYRTLPPYCFGYWYSRWARPLIKKFPPRSGPLNKASIERIMKRNRHKLIGCANWTAISQPSVTTRLKLKFIIRPDGEVGRVTVKTGKQKLPYLRDCLVRKIKRLVFPRPDGFDPVEVSYPLVFRY